MRCKKVPAFLLAAGLCVSPSLALSEKKIDAGLDLLIEEKQVLQKIQQEKFAEARQILPQEIKQARAEGKENTAALQLLSLLDYRNHDYKKALSYLLKVDTYQKRINSELPLRQTLLNFRIADCYYQMRQYKQAQQRYVQALAFAEKAQASLVLQMELLEGISACLADAHSYSEALPYCKKLVEISRVQASNPDLAYASTYMWALLRISKVYREGGDIKAGESAKAEALKLMNSLVDLRSELLGKASLNEDVDEYVSMLFNYLKATQPETSTDWLWILSQVQLKTLPVIAWGQSAPSPKAAIICIHGLGLDNRAFSIFGAEMAARGFAVYALDVRGFGSWIWEKGYEQAAYSSTLGDIVTLCGVVRKKHPGVPLYLLGESMGGNIALRAAAEQPQCMDGIISAVPSAQMAEPVKLSLQVALHALDGLDKPFDIGQTIAPMATDRSKLIAAWEIDPNAKTRMSPKALMKYALYLNMTKGLCAKIENTPVLMAQGLSDRLMSPQGTVALFDAISNKDKTILAIGTGQHLLFETDRQNKFLLDALVAWIENHRSAEPKH